jgi:hypothetical protein
VLGVDFHARNRKYVPGSMQVTHYPENRRNLKNPHYPFYSNLSYVDGVLKVEVAGDFITLNHKQLGRLSSNGQIFIQE